MHAIAMILGQLYTDTEVIMQARSTILITGATGFIGQHLLKRWTDAGHRILAYTRRNSLKGLDPNVTWFQDFATLSPEAIDYVVNLAGENIGAARWSDKRKQQLIDSRIHTTTILRDWLLQHGIHPKCIVSASAIGFYGIDDTEQWTQRCDETADSQNIFVSELCQQWEAVWTQAPHLNLKIMRLGIVLGANGGILPQMLLPIKLNAVGKIGHGRQPIAWVHLADVMQAIEFLWRDTSSQRVFNVVAPELTTQAQFAKTASRILGRVPFLPAPAWLFQLALGEQSQLILNGQFVVPKALEAAGFQFQYPTLQSALAQILKKN